jgi:hypothetical protein
MAARVGDLVAEIGASLVADTRRAALSYATMHGLRRSIVRIDPGVLARPVPNLLGVTVFGPCPDPKTILVVPHEAARARAFGALRIWPVGTCKAAGLASWIKELSRGRHGLDRVVAFGDGYNDGCLLGSCALGVAVRGADPVALEHSSLRLDAPLEDFLADFATPHGQAAALGRATPRRTGGIPTAAGPGPCFGAHRRAADAGAAIVGH